MKSIPLAKPILGLGERRAVSRVLRSGVLAQGPEVANFESEFSRYVNGRDCVAVNSGTSALHLALIALGIGAGDEVIIPSFTFAATANSVSLSGATPVFVDIDPITFNLDPDLIERAVTKQTKAIMPVHLYGLPAEMPAILGIAKKHKLLVIEDAAQAHLASIDAKPVGTYGDAAVFSFYPTKNMTSGEGGMIVLRDPQHAEACRLYRNQGMKTRYQNEVIGFNLRMTDIHAAIGRVQLRKVEKWTNARIANAQFLSEGILGLQTPRVPSKFRHVFHQYTVRVVSNRDLYLNELKKYGIEAGVYYPTQVHKLPSFRRSNELPETQKATEQVLSLPVHPSLTLRELKRIVQAVNRVSELIS